MDKQPLWPVALGVGGALALIGGVGGFLLWKAGSQGAAKAPSGPLTAASAMIASHRGSCPEGMVFVPAGTFTMGSPDGEGKADEHPAHPVKLGAFCIDGTEVTVGSYRGCVKEKRGELQCKAPHQVPMCNWGHPARSKHPINCVDWEQATTYCKWAGGALPTEAQWEYAARGTDGRKFPWGNEPPQPNHLNACGAECGEAHPGPRTMFDKSDRFLGTAPVGSYPDGASPFGAMDMAGNVFEWVADWYAPYPASQDLVDNPTGPGTGGDEPAHMFRGGSHLSRDAIVVRAAARQLALSKGSPSAGFRCVRKP